MTSTHEEIDALVNQAKIEIEFVLHKVPLDNAYKVFILETIKFEHIEQSLDKGGHK